MVQIYCLFSNWIQAKYSIRNPGIKTSNWYTNLSDYSSQLCHADNLITGFRKGIK